MINDSARPTAQFLGVSVRVTAPTIVGLTLPAYGIPYG